MAESKNWQLVEAGKAHKPLGFKTAKALREAARNGLVPCIRIGRRVRFDLDRLKEWAAQGGTPLGAENTNAQTQGDSVQATT
ncbi:MAG: hypothetical protein AB7U82_08325 [Blastocatellales bacterium]